MTSVSLRRDAPGARGVDAAGVSAFLRAVAADGLELHGFLLYRAGAVVAEGFWAPYAAHRPHMLHSAVKSWTSTAVGLAIGDGKLRLDDKVVSFFPQHLPPIVSDNLAAMTVEDLLTMRSGHRTGISGGEWREMTESWVAAFLREEVADRPGEEFIYSSGSSYMLSAIVTAVTGRTMHELMEERVFRPLGCGEVSWDVSPEGYSSGGNGISCTAEDMLKFGVLFLADGVWEGRRLLPPGWVAEATRNHVCEVWMAPLDGKRFLSRDTLPPSAIEKREGYGYQWWMTPFAGYRASGLFGQQCIVLPGHDAVIVITAGVRAREPRLLTHVWEHLVPALGSATRSDPAAEARLADELGDLGLPMPCDGARSGIASAVSGAPFRVAANEDGVTAVGFDFDGRQCRFTLRDDRGLHEVTVGLERPVEGETTMTGAKLHHQYQPDRMRVVASGDWLDERTFRMTWRFVETAFCDTVLCRFDGRSLRLERSVNTNAGATSRPVLTGLLVPQAA